MFNLYLDSAFPIVKDWYSAYLLLFSKSSNSTPKHRTQKNKTKTQHGPHQTKTNVNEVFAKGKPWVDLYQIWNIYIFSGNEKLHTMTEHDPYILRVELEDLLLSVLIRSSVKSSEWFVFNVKW
jgi:hypothetical protein